jgi:hypothetical protein
MAALAALVVAGIVALAVSGIGSSSTPSSSAACVDVMAASTLGGAQLHACGPDAARLCSSAGAGSSPLAHALRPQCGRLHMRVGAGSAP